MCFCVFYDSCCVYVINDQYLMAALESRDPAFYNLLLSGVNDDQRKTLQDIYVLADQRLAAAGRWRCYAA